MKLKIGGATVNQIPFDWKNNSQNIIDAIAEAKAQGLKIVCFPELCITGYGCEDVFLSDWLPERAWKEVLHIREFCSDITISVGLPVRIGSVTYNGACVISNKKILGITFKQFLAKDGVHYEPRWFDPWIANKTIEITRGDEVIPVGDIVYDAEGIRFGFEICEDGWRKKDRPGYRLLVRNVDIILNPRASHFAMVKSLLREEEVVGDGAALFNCVYVFANLLGNEAGRMIYDGDIIIGQKEKLIAINKRFSFKPFNVVGTEVDFKDPSKSHVIAPT